MTEQPDLRRLYESCRVAWQNRRLIKISPMSIKYKRATARLTYLNIRQQVRQFRLETALSTLESIPHGKARRPCMYHRDSDKALQLTLRAPCARGG